MIGIISSTINPSQRPILDGKRTVFSPEERLIQTIESIESLIRIGVKEIIVIDNSPFLKDNVEAKLKPAQLIRVGMYSFQNKGISEALSLLSVIDKINRDGPVIKLSGRYAVEKSEIINQIDWDRVDVVGNGVVGWMNTRCYIVSNIRILNMLMNESVRQMYRGNFRIVGPRSLRDHLIRLVRPGKDRYQYHDPPFSLEFGLYQAIKHLGLRANMRAKIVVRGQLGGGAAGGERVVD